MHLVPNESYFEHTIESAKWPPNLYLNEKVNQKSKRIIYII